MKAYFHMKHRLLIFVIMSYERTNCLFRKHMSPKNRKPGCKGGRLDDGDKLL